GEADNVASDVETLLGGTGNDSLTGGAANNRLVGNAGNDTLSGAAGDDTMDGGLGADVFNGGDGNDTADYSTRTTNLTIDIDDTGDDGTSTTVNGQIVSEGDNVHTDVENVIGGSANDIITGSIFNNSLVGGRGTTRF